MFLSKLRAYVRQHHVGLIAVFLALGGSAYAASKIDSKDVADNSLTGADVRGRTGKKFTQGSLTGADVRGSAASGRRKAVNGSLTGFDMKDDSLTGFDVLEGSLGPVPKAGDADTLGGFGPGAFASAVRTNEQWTSDCDTPSTLNECAPVTIDVPPGKSYRAAVWSAATVETNTASTDIQYCAGYRNVSAGGGATCFRGLEGISLANNYAEAVATSGDTSMLGVDLGPGTWK